MPGGRPSDYNESKLAVAADYLENYQSMGDIVPSFAGLADELGVRPDRCTAWGSKNPEFQAMLDKINAKQHRLLLAGGLGGTHNSNICKLMLSKHGYSDKQEIDQTSSDGSMTPTKIEILPIETSIKGS